MQLVLVVDHGVVAPRPRGVDPQPAKPHTDTVGAWMSSSENILHVSPKRPIRRSMCAFRQFREQPVARLPWGHITVLLDRLDDNQVRQWYAAQDVQHG